MKTKQTNKKCEGIKLAIALLVITLTILTIMPIAYAAANNPGHDSLYIEQQGDSTLNGTLNITNNITISGGRTYQSSGLSIYGNDYTTAPSSEAYISGVTGSNLYLEGQGNIYIKYLSGGDTVFIGKSGITATDLNVSGALFIQSGTATIGGQSICLANGTGCPSSLGGANLTANSATTGYLVQFQNGSTLNNSVIFQNNSNIGIGKTDPSYKVDINGDFGANNIYIANPGVGSDSRLTFLKSNDNAWLSVKEVTADATTYGFYMNDNPDGTDDKFLWEIDDWQGSGGDWQPLLFSNLDANIRASDVNAYGDYNVYGPWYSATHGQPTTVWESKSGTLSITPNVAGFTGDSSVYWVRINGTGNPNTFNWGYGSYSPVYGSPPTASNVAITGSAQTLADGVTITFSGTTGGVVNDSYQFRANKGGHVLVSNGSATAPTFSFIEDNNNGIYLYGADKLEMVTGGSNRITIDNNGNVGIGTTSPNTTLHVNGKINVTAGNDICISGGNCLSTVSSADGNNYTTGVGLNVSGSTLTIATNITGRTSITNSVTMNDTTRAMPSTCTGNQAVQTTTSTTTGTCVSFGTGSSNSTLIWVANGTGLNGGNITTGGSISLQASGITAATYGNATAVGVCTYDTYGRATSCTNQTITGDGNNYTTGVGLNVSGSTLTIATNITGRTSITNSVTMNDTTRAMPSTCTGNQAVQTTTSTTTGTCVSFGTGSSNSTLIWVANGTGLNGGNITTGGSISLQASGITAATYGNATAVGVCTYDTYGRATSCTNQTITGDGNNYTTGISLNNTGQTFQLNLARSGISTNLTATLDFSSVFYNKTEIDNQQTNINTSISNRVINSTITSLQTNITSVNTTVGTHTSQISGIQTNITSVNTTAVGKATTGNCPSGQAIQNISSSAIQCITPTVSESDPQVGSVTNTYGCYADGSAVQCGSSAFTYDTGTGTLSATTFSGGLSGALTCTDCVDGSDLADSITLDANLAFTGYNVSVDTTTFAVDVTNDRVGIGTAAPIAGLTVNGAGQLTGSVNTTGNLSGTLYLGDTGGSAGNGGMILFGANGNSWRFASIKGHILNGADNTQGDIVFSTRPGSTDATLTEAMRVYYNGNIGIGVASPTEKLSVAGDINVSSSSDVSTTAGTGAFYIISGSTGIGFDTDEIQSWGTTIYMQYDGAQDLDVGNGDLFVETSGGNTGIGTTGPNAKLDVLNTAGPQMRLSYSTSAYSNFTTDSGGNLTVRATGGNIIFKLG